MKCSIGVIVYNEEANIAKLLSALLNQKLDIVEIDEIIVVSSACTDCTDKIVAEFAQNHSKINLITEAERRGKSAAVNTFIAASKNPYLIIESGDTIPANDVVEQMITAFQDEKIGMSGGRPVPENDEKSFVGYSVNLLWRLHHQMALKSPKLGEMVAFRNIVKSIPNDSAVDEASIEAVIREHGLLKKYIPTAIIHNKGPENISDFILQRRRIEAGHIWLMESSNYQVISQNKGVLISLAWNEFLRAPQKVFYLIGTMIIEIYSRILGKIDFKYKNKNPYKWEIANSTKQLKHK